MTAYDWEFIISDALLHGKGRLHRARPRDGSPVQLHLLTADKMRRTTTDGQDDLHPRSSSSHSSRTCSS